MSFRVRTAITTAVTALLTFSGSTMAQASNIYPPVDACMTSTAAVTLGDTVDFSCEGGTFAADEPITITITGENATSASFAFVRFEISTLSYASRATSTGAMPDVRITLPADASGIYNIAAVSASSAGGTASISVLDADGLPVTGGDSGQLMGLWIGGGALLLAGVVVLVAAGLRRRSDD